MTVLIVIGVLFVLAMVASPTFRGKVLQVLRIKSDEALSKATTAAERNKDRLNQLQQRLPQQRARVARVMATATAKQRELDAAVANRAKLEGEYQTAKAANASAEALGAIANDYRAAKTSVTSLQQQLQEAHSQSDEAQKELDDILTQLQSMAHMVDDQAAKEELAQAYRESAKTRQELNDMKSGLGNLADDFKKTESDLDQARSLDELSKGSATDREREELARKANENAAVAELEADLDGGK